MILPTFWNSKAGARYAVQHHSEMDVAGYQGSVRKAKPTSYFLNRENLIQGLFKQIFEGLKNERGL